MAKIGISAVIFDMDGVISDTEKIHAQTESHLLKKYGVVISPEEITRRYAGIKFDRMLTEITDNHLNRHEIDKIVREKWKLMESCNQMIKPIEGSTELIKEFYDSGLRMAVASSSNYSYVVSIINKLGLEKYFLSLIGGDMVTNGKPDPEIFILAAEKMKVNPENCLVIEDGISGMKAAKSANMQCIGLVEHREDEYPTKNLVLSLNEISFSYLERLSLI